MARTATDGVDASAGTSVEVEPQIAARQATDSLPPQISVEAADAALASDRAASLAFAGQSSRDASLAAELAPATAFAPMTAYVLERRAEFANASAISAAEPRSAMLEDPASLRPARAACGGSEPSLLIDLDPSDGIFSPPETPQAQPALAMALSQLRDQGVFIAWISNNPASRADDIRIALSRSGLDPQDKDQILLMRYPGDRKQTRREDFAASSCLLAIAGDTRSDFDELFDYLVNPEAALGLELLIGDGWFLIPPAFAQPSAPIPEGQ